MKRWKRIGPGFYARRLGKRRWRFLVKVDEVLLDAGLPLCDGERLRVVHTIGRIARRHGVPVPDNLTGDAN